MNQARKNALRKSDFSPIEAVNALAGVSFPMAELFTPAGVFCLVEPIQRASYLRFPHRCNVI
jgi:hypothetical protein